MTITPTTANTATGGANASDTAANPQQTLSQKDFLQLLVTQMENQDPLNPQSDTEMAAQMAQFTSLTQSSSMASSLGMIQASGLIGSTVNIQVNSNSSISGVVSGVQVTNGAPQILVNGTGYSLSQVTGISPATPATTAPQPASAPSQTLY